jgi:uncharacterized protein YndB with AHSA1/START domain
MAQIHVAGERRLAAPADRVYRCLANYREHHPRILPPAFSDFRVEEGGVGAGTVISFRVRAGGRVQQFRQSVSEPQPGRVLVESDPEHRTTFTVDHDGVGSRLRIDTVFEASGLQGMVARWFAPRLLGKLYADELRRIEAYVLEHSEI